MSGARCQMFSVPEMSDPLQPIDIVWQRRNRLKRILKRRVRYLLNSFLCASRVASGSPSSFVSREDFPSGSTPDASPLAPHRSLPSVPGGTSSMPGDLVCVRSRKEIEATLDRWNQLKGCSFMEEMQPYCGTTQRVFKRVAKFLDERDYLMKKCQGIVLLENAICEGTNDFGNCDRACFYFWRQEWLERVA